jgi:hypothetical protein
MKYEAMSLTTDRVCMVTRPAVSLPRRNTTDGGIGMIEICSMSFATEMHMIGLITDAMRVSALS